MSENGTNGNGNSTKISIPVVLVVFFLGVIGTLLGQIYTSSLSALHAADAQTQQAVTDLQSKYDDVQTSLQKIETNVAIICQTLTVKCVN